MGEFVEGALVLKCSSKPCGNNGHVYNVQVNTAANGDEWFGCGFEDPKLNVDDECEFEIEQVEGGKYTNIILDTLIVTKAAPQRERSSRGGNDRGSSRSGNNRGGNSRGGSDRGRNSSRDSSRSGGRNSSRDSAPQRGGRAPAKEAAPKVDWERKDNLIRLQSCQNTAVNTINVMLVQGFIAIPKAKADRYDAIQALIEDEAKRLYYKYEDIVDGNYDQGGDEGRDDQDQYPDDVPS